MSSLREVQFGDFTVQHYKCTGYPPLLMALKSTHLNSETPKDNITHPRQLKKAGILYKLHVRMYNVSTQKLKCTCCVDYFLTHHAVCIWLGTRYPNAFCVSHVLFVWIAFLSFTYLACYPYVFLCIYIRTCMYIMCINMLKPLMVS